jgi:hypothetical protein
MRFQVFFGYGSIVMPSWEWCQFETDNYWEAVKFWAEYETTHGVEKDSYLYIHDEEDNECIMTVYDRNGFCTYSYYKEISCGR